MLFFSKSTDQQAQETDSDQAMSDDQLLTESSQTMTDDRPSEDYGKENISPFARKSRERQRKLDSLTGRIIELNNVFEQISAFSTQSEHSIRYLSDYIAASKKDVETEIRLESENANLTNKVLHLEQQIEIFATQLNDSEATVHALRKRGTETRTALETARNDIVTLRETYKKLNDEYNHQANEAARSNASLSQVSDAHEALQSKHAILSERFDNLNTDLENYSKREFELEHNLSELTTLFDRESKKNKYLTSELESLKREFNEIKNENIDLKSQMDVATDELEYQKTRFQEEQRKHDDIIYSMNSEIENITLQKRVIDQSLNEIKNENKKLKDRIRDSNTKLQEVQHLLDSAQKSHESDRSALQASNSKLRELNLRYNSALSELNHEKNQNRKYSDNIEALISEAKSLRKYKIMYETSQDQIDELKEQLRNYQAIIEGSASSMDIADWQRDLTAKALDANKDSNDKPKVIKLHDH